MYITKRCERDINRICVVYKIMIGYFLQEENPIEMYVLHTLYTSSYNIMNQFEDVLESPA